MVSGMHGCFKMSRSVQIVQNADEMRKTCGDNAGGVVGNAGLGKMECDEFI